MTDYKKLDFEGLRRWREEILKEKMSYEVLVAIPNGTCARTVGSEKIVKAFKEEIKERNLQNKVEVRTTACSGLCAAEPNVIIYLNCQGCACQKAIFYVHLKPEDVKRIVKETIIRKKIIDEFLYIDPVTKKKIVYKEDITFYNRQTRIVSSYLGLQKEIILDF